jgi:hypothetical protein
MDIGESILTRFASGGNKDLLCKYIKYLSPVQIVTDLRSDPEDPFQWEPGQLGRVHRQSWLQHRRWVLENIAACYKDDTRQITLLLRVASQLNYVDLIQQLSHIMVDKPFDIASGMKTWNVLYGPYRGTQYIPDKDIASAILGLIQTSLEEPLRLLLDMYAVRITTRPRNLFLEAAVTMGHAGVFILLISRLGKPKQGQRLLELAIENPDPEILRSIFNNFSVFLNDTLMQAIIAHNSVPVFSAIPERMHIDYREEVIFALQSQAHNILQFLQPRYHDFSWLMASLNTGTSFRGASEDAIKRTIIEILRHPDFRYPRDVDLMGLYTRAPRAGAYLQLILHAPEVWKTLTKEELDALYDKWKHRPKLGRVIQSIIRKRFQRPMLEGEPPTKMVKDPLDFYV